MPFLSPSRRANKTATLPPAAPLVTTEAPPLRNARSMQQFRAQREADAFVATRPQPRIDTRRSVVPRVQREGIVRTLETFEHHAAQFVAHLYKSEPKFATWACAHGGTPRLSLPNTSSHYPPRPWGWMCGALHHTATRALQTLERARNSTIEDFFRATSASVIAAHEFNRLTLYMLHFKDDVRARLKVVEGHNAVRELVIEGMAEHLPERNIWRLPLHIWDKLLVELETSPLRGVKSMKAVVQYWRTFEHGLARLSELLSEPDARHIMSPSAHAALSQRREQIRQHICDLERGFDDHMTRPGWPQQRPAQNAPMLGELVPIPQVLAPVPMEPIASAPPAENPATRRVAAKPPQLAPLERHASNSLRGVVPPLQRTSSRARLYAESKALSVEVPRRETLEQASAQLTQALAAKARVSATGQHNRAQSTPVLREVAPISDEVQRLMDEMWSSATLDAP